MVSTTEDAPPVLTAENSCSENGETIEKLKENGSNGTDQDSDCEIMEIENEANGHSEDKLENGVHDMTNGASIDETNGLTDNDNEVECIELDDDEDEKEPLAKKAKIEPEETSASKSEEKKCELNSPEALLDKLDEYVADAINSKKQVERKILDALLGAINVQVQKEPLSVRKLILDKKLVLPNTISFPPSNVVDMLIEHDPDFPLSKVITKMFGEDRPKLSDAEKKEKAQLKQNNPAPHMTKVLLDIGQDLVQEATYCDIVHAKNLPEMPKNIETYRTVAAQLKPVWEALKKKNEVYKMPILKCQVCGFQTESRLILQNHRSKSHFKSGKYQCAMCPEFDTNEQRLINHYLESHLIIATKDEQQAKYPCLICDEDFQYKGLRDQHMKQCKKDYSKIRYMMAPKGQEDILTVNRWLWERPPIDPTILQQQQAAQAQQKKQIQQAAQLQNQAAIRRNVPLNQQAAILQQQLLRSHQQQQRQLQQQLNTFTKNIGINNNALIAAMQQHLQRQAGGKNQMTNLAAAMAVANNKNNLRNVGFNQTILAAQQQFAQQALKRAANTPNQINQAAAKQIMNLMAGGHTSTNSTPSNNNTTCQICCEICDEPLSDKETYLTHLQGTHKQMRGKVLADMNQGAPLACSRCKERFWTYEGLERHLVMSHGLVTADLLQKAQKKGDGGKCKLCAKQYAFNMLQHLVADHQIKLCSAEIMYSCDVCSFKCSSYHLLENHLSTVHPKNGEKVENGKKTGEECITLDD